MQLTTRNLSTSPVAATSTESSNSIVESQDSFQWISSESLLRDEGALFGIAGADITDKMNAIASFFKSRGAAALQKKQYLDQKIQDIDLVLSVSHKELENLKSVSGEKVRPVNNLLPLCFQLLAILSVCIFNFFLVRWWLSPAIQSDIISLGIYLFGLFSVYISRGLEQELTGDASVENISENPARWKFFSREFTVAAAVALFICTLTFRSYPVEHSIAAFLVLFILFLTGKVLINTLFKLREQGADWLGFLAADYKAKRKERRLTKAIEKSEAFLDKTRLEVIEPATILKKLEAEQEYKTRVFLSEYNLALQSRTVTNKSQAKQFV